MRYQVTYRHIDLNNKLLIKRKKVQNDICTLEIFSYYNDTANNKKKKKLLNDSEDIKKKNNR